MKLGKLASGNGGGLLHANSCSCGLKFDQASAAIRAWRNLVAVEGTSAPKYVVVLLPKDRGRMNTRSIYRERGQGVDVLESKATSAWIELKIKKRRGLDKQKGN
jgi:hypothetical protein